MSIIRIESRFGSVPSNYDEAYLPYHTARDSILAESEVPVHSVFDVISSIRNGIMPKRGAVAELGHGVMAGFDLVTLERVSTKEAIIVPAPKSAVDDETDRIVERGGITYTDDDGNLKIVGLIDRDTGFNTKGIRTTKIGAGLVLHEIGLSLPNYRVVASEEGLIVARSAMPKL